MTMAAQRMTPASSPYPYCTSMQFFDFYSRQLAADMLRSAPEAPRPSYLAMLDPANPVGARLAYFLKKGAGEIEAACSKGHRYEPADLLALDGVSAVLLQGLNSARAMWGLYCRLKPGSARPQDCPMASESEALLKELRDGNLIFTFTEVQDADLPSVQPQGDPQQLLTANVVSRAQRLFPGYGLNSWPHRDNGGGNG